MKRRGFVFLFIFSFLFLKNSEKVFSKETDFIFPVKNPRVSIEFGESWFAGEYVGWLRGHLGEDFLGHAGTDVFAINNGVVVSIGKWAKNTYSEKKCELIDGVEKCSWISFKTHGWGPTIVLEHELEKGYYNLKNTTLDFELSKKQINKVYSLYGHLDNVDNFNIGDKIVRGEKISEIGDIADWVTKHLHFEIKNEEAFKNDILNGIGAGYSKKDNYAPNHYSPSIFIKNNSDIIIDNNIQSSTQENNNIYNSYSVEFLDNNQDVFVQKDSELEIKFKIKNLGDKIISDKLSFNVLGGLKKNEVFRHDSWITNLRPALLNQSIENNQEREFSFLIKTPDELGEFVFEFTVVENGSWKQITKNIFKVNLIIKENLAEEKEDKQESKEKEKNIIKKIVDNIQEKTEKVIKDIKNIFIGSSIYNKTADNNSKEEDDVIFDDEFDYNFSLVFPSSSFYSTNTEKINIFGTKTSDLEKIYINSSSQEILFSSSTWQKEIILDQGENYFNIYADQVSSSIDFIIKYEKILSLPLLEITEINTEKNILNISWLADNADFYDLEIKRNDSDWQEIFSKTTSTEFTTSTLIDENFFVRVRSRDLIDNTSDWVYKNYLIEHDRTVVINEIAWMGVASNKTNYEWIELYNNSEEEVDLSGWSLYIENHSGTSSTIDLSGSIKKDSYFLLARNEDVFKDVAEDLLFNFSLHNSGAKLMLFDNCGRLIDETNQKDSWFSGQSSGKYRTAERVDSKISGNDRNNWKTNSIFHYKSTSKDSVIIYGSPDQDNNSFFYIPSSIENFYPNFWAENNEFIFKKEHSPYLFDNFVIPFGHKATVEPGVIIFGISNESKITVEGEFELLGNETEKIYISSRYDNIYNKTNLGFNSEATAGNWKNIEIKNGKMQANFVEFRYGGYRDYISNKHYSNLLRNFGGELILNNVKIENSFAYTEKREKDSFIYNTGFLKAENSTFADGYSFLYSNSPNVELLNNVFSNFEARYPFYLENKLVNIFENNIFSSSSDKIYVGIMDFNEEVNFYKNTKYVFNTLNINPSSTMNIFEGTELFFSLSGKLNIFGNLNVFGTENEKVSIRGNNSFSAIFISGANFFADHLDIFNGGYFTTIKHYPILNAHCSYVLWLKNSTVDLSNTRFFNTRRPGSVIYSTNSNISLKDSYLGWSTGYEKLSSWYDDGINLFWSHLFLDNVTFQKMDVAIKNNSYSETTYVNMTRDNFLDFYCRQNSPFWTPINLFSFNPCTPKINVLNIPEENLLLDLNNTVSPESKNNQENEDDFEDESSNSILEEDKILEDLLVEEESLINFPENIVEELIYQNEESENFTEENVSEELICESESNENLFEEDVDQVILEEDATEELIYENEILENNKEGENLEKLF